MVLADQKPESARSVSSPAAPARRKRVMSSPQKRGAAGGVGAAGAQPGVQHLAGVGSGRQQRVVAELSGVAVAGALLAMPADLDDGGVHVDGHRPIARAGAGGPRAGEDLLGEAVELAGVAEGERAQERPDGGRRQDAVAEHGAGGPAAQHVHVVDAVPAGEHGVDQGEQLGAGVGGAWPRQADVGVGRLADAEPVGQGGGQQQPGAGNGMAVVEADVELVKVWGGVAWDAGIEKVPFLACGNGRQTPVFSQLRGPFSCPDHAVERPRSGSRLSHADRPW